MTLIIKFDSILNILSDIADNEPLLLEESALDLLQYVPSVTKNEQLSTNQKLAYCELLSTLACSLSLKLSKHMGRPIFMKRK
jgi:hypothetical protein